MHLARPLLLASLASLLGSPLLAQNTANTCNQAPTVTDGVHAFSTNSATASGVEPNNGMCQDFGQTNPESLNDDIWFEFIPATSDTYVFSTCDDANYDSKIAVYTGSCGSLVPLGCNDDGSGCSGFSSKLTLNNIVTSSTYYVQIGGFSTSDNGTGNLTIEPDSPPVGGTIGPDIAVSGVGNNDWTNYGTSGGIRAYSFATTSCGVGDEEVNWFSGIGNDHPLIGQNLYRIDNGRIEMLGYSFLKHGFCAVNENSCGTCQSTSCSTLGIGCADTYSSSLNDGDSGASKRSVNATTGTYVGNPGPTGDPATINGRLQVLDSELTGIVIAESQYVSEHDHSEGLARNNASWRRVSVAGSGSLSGNGSVNMFDPGIFAWEALSGATINEVVNTNEGGMDVHGYFFLGYQVTDLGGGQWRYEYALTNFNSDRSGQRFEIPVPNGTSVTNVYFRDINHHSGDPYSNTDWSYTQTSSAVRWECETYAQNQDANALRWGTLYNFGFTSNGAPQAATSEIGLFKPGTPIQLTSSVQGPGSGSIIDCNNNGTNDADDIQNGTSQDCNNNGIPDECEADCDNDGIPDDCEVDCNNNGTPDDCESFTDCNNNGIPDDCEPDCDNDGIPDDCEPDCDNDGTPDDCEVDCNNNGTPDDCESFTDCNNNGIPDDCEPDCDNDGLPDDCEADCNNNGTPDECENFADCNNNGIPDDCEPDCNNDGIPDDCEVDCNNNGTPDACESFSDCNNNGIPDDCEADCDNDGTPDACEVDCNGNGTPDDCESFTDCNNNNVPDSCDIATGTSQDCNGNFVPDECENLTDCNNNNVPDGCDIASGTSQDCNNNGVPDECEGLADCNNNGTADVCDISSGVSQDCNNNGIPDECEGLPDCNGNFTPDSCDIASGTSQDCNNNGIPDECEPDCDNDGTPDDCEVDCDNNGTPDDCENIIDCNSNGTPDSCDIASGTSQDANNNGIPDECECGGVNYCQTAPNSVGSGATIWYTGSSSVAANDLMLRAQGLPAQQFGIFYYGPNQLNAPFGEGFRCVGGSTTRLPVLSSNNAGNVNYAIDNTNLPPTAGAIIPGAVWNFQFWYRDPAGGGTSYNLTDALEMTFCN
ncbi:MAG: hypothetical protein ACI835_001005 [Planctomycetota bacterium]|jgi:hypothetical protein